MFFFIFYIVQPFLINDGHFPYAYSVILCSECEFIEYIALKD